MNHQTLKICFNKQIFYKFSQKHSIIYKNIVQYFSLELDQNKTYMMMHVFGKVRVGSLEGTKKMRRHK